MSVREIQSSRKKKEIKTFTYFLPAPAQRKNGYREKEFDKIMNGILQSGFELLELKTQGTNNGMFVIALLKVTSKKLSQLDKNLDIHERFKLQDTHASDEIELVDEHD